MSYPEDPGLQTWECDRWLVPSRVHAVGYATFFVTQHHEQKGLELL
eukprot:CAMPEP_0115766650 /NCGR_PEP_ID=MMETSP0272-20121206/103259_1 /TAXON_ID=71861 /ORGANISM="Scrippsiella trochoidea, Strain CCMP3099" /LENGTH=45 /DNA_ID= /DNA_START= /DNA_END= /DNA_ORIENTATION=